MEIVAAPQPELPERDRPWSTVTLRFWDQLGESSIAPELTATEWDVLQLAAAAYEEIWAENKLTRIDAFMSIMGRFPFTPKDRQALRVQALTGEELERRNRRESQRAAAQVSKEKARAAMAQLRVPS